jgi:post-segregation antitoxin (ccd killing protein)
VQEIAMSTAKQRRSDETVERPISPKPERSAEAQQWLEENAEAIKQWNEWVEKNGLPLERHRQF